MKALIIVFVIFAVSAFLLFVVVSDMSRALDRERYKILRVVDGDTLEIEAKFLPSSLPQTLKVRIEGIDAPESGHRAFCDKERELAEKAKQFVIETLAKSRKQEVVLKKWGKFGGRILGDVVLDKNKLLSELMVDKGHAVRYDGTGTKKDWCK